MLTSTEPTDLATSDSPRSSPRRSWRASGLSAWLGLLPFFAFIGVFLVWPAVAVFGRAFEQTEGAEVPAMREAMTGQYRDYFVDSLKLSAVTAVIGGVIGTVLALVLARLQRPRWLRSAVAAFAGVAANMGGLILAFAFIAALGTQGLLTKVITSAGIDVPPQFIASFWGLVIVYLYFQIPLMLLVMLPAADGLKPEWREAASNLGGTAVTYWRRVGIPVLAPAALGGMLLLFANAFAAYATAFALTTGSGNLVPLQIRFYLQGNAITGKAGLGYALAAWMILLMLVTMGAYLLLRRRAERWRR
jgi:putative spermidine/putrescine transport system permease protein